MVCLQASSSIIIFDHCIKTNKFSHNNWNFIPAAFSHQTSYFPEFYLGSKYDSEYDLGSKSYSQCNLGSIVSYTVSDVNSLEQCGDIMDDNNDYDDDIIDNIPGI